MTPTDVIERCLTAIREQFYAETPADARAYSRDHGALVKAVCRYGAECDRRGWRFDEMSVTQAILKLLPQIKRPDHQWLPTYLENCIDRHVGQRSEELQAEARKLEPRIAAAMQAARTEALPGGVVVQPLCATEALALMHRELAARTRARRTVAKAKPVAEQASLF